jgi:hypothetical protein
VNDKTPTTREVEGVLSREPRGGTLSAVKLPNGRITP